MMLSVYLLKRVQWRFCGLEECVCVCFGWPRSLFSPSTPSSKDQAEMDPADMEDVEDVEEEETGEDENSKGRLSTAITNFLCWE